jgi:hypothetical protein
MPSHLAAKSAKHNVQALQSSWFIIVLVTCLLRFQSPGTAMPLRLLAAKKEENSQAPSQGPAKARKGDQAKSEAKEKKEKPKTDKHMSVLMTLVLKSILRNFQDGRDLQAVVFDTGVAEASLPELEAASAEATGYNEQTLGNKGHGLGPPHPYILGGLVDSLMEQLKLKAAIEASFREMAQRMELLAQHLEASSIEAKCEMCRFFKLTKCYKTRGETQKMRITMAWGVDQKSQDARALIKAALTQLSLVEFKMGRPPPGAMERELQEWLETFLN